ncbi:MULTISPECIES: diacylglycerol/lipid kinase family protein [Aerococcus]|uniref:diacylglycerol/lipid kinase family protein n=1 Tax=Aerococcus TaxID=1375 RepID=UPI0015EB8D49|nr:MULTISPECIES: diacylglycerol kinase family protein [Aerococcus]MBU5611086.1 hypothetical protein [Aerococcus urinae]MDK6291734.1 diacylglycerol kinase family protein [Aerococcus urinae]MDK6376067.1 diacylglycerol kinase family protein [Aerococcus urinae]MDK6421655.1 diacylglycerol kinase family protein [Aerococcus urinae]MDK8076075.1 diacylglycerol kinase family protein [Aerococcus urinae]
MIEIICHEEAGLGRGRKVLDQVQAYLDDHQQDYRVHTTAYPGHIFNLVPELLDNFQKESRLLVIGGDGTLHELVAVLQAKQVNIPLTYLPAGSGNDFSRYFQQDKSSLSDYLVPLVEERSPKTLPIYHYQLGQEGRRRSLVNSLGLGFDGLVIEQAIKLKESQGIFDKPWGNKLRYLVGLFQSLPRLSLFNCHLKIDGQPYHFDRCALVVFMNNPYFGGGIHLYPLEKIKDRQVSAIVIHDINPLAIVDLLSRIFISHQQASSAYMTHLSGEVVEVEIDSPMISQVDGESLMIDQYPVRVWQGQQDFYL